MAALRKRFYWFVGALVLTAGCARHVEFKEAPYQKDFGATVPDKNLNLSLNFKPIHPASLPQDRIISVSSADWFDFATELLAGGQETSPLGHSLVRSFYGFNETHTTMTGTVNPPGSPFAEAAFCFARPIMTKTYNESLLKAETKVVAAAEKVSIPLYDLDKYPPPEIILQRMIQGLADFKGKLLQQSDRDDPVIKSITTTIDTKILGDLQDMKESATMDPQIPLIKNLKNLEASLMRLPEISDFDRQRLLTQVRLAINLTEKNNLIKSSDEALAFLVDVWLAKEMRKKFPPQLASVFNGLTEAQLLTFATLDANPIVSEAQWPIIKDETDTLILSDQSLVAFYLKNNGLVLDRPHFTSLGERIATFNNLLSQSDISYFARLVANIPSQRATEQRYALISSWLGIPERVGMPDEIKAVFSQLSENDLDLIGHNNSALLVARLDVSQAKLRYGLIDALDKKGVDYVKTLFINSITSAIKERLDLALLPIAKSYSDQLTNTLLPLLEKSRGEADKVSAISYNDFGRYYLGKLVFGADTLTKGDSQKEVHDNGVLQKYKLPLIEKSQVNFSFQGGNWTPVESPAETSPKVLGLSLGVVEERVAQDPEHGVALEYEAISKLLAISGYHDAENNLVESFMTSMTTGHVNELFDVKSYDPTYIVFAVPDGVKLKDQFKMDTASRFSPQVSVEGQMDLLHGYAKLMKFFKPWNSSSYDLGLGAIRIDEAKSIIPFDRSDYFLLSVGLGAYILKNIPLKMLGLISSSNGFIDGTKVQDPSQVSVVAATLSDYTPAGMSHKITTSSVARAILAMSEFYEQIKDLQKSSDPIIISQIKGDSFRASQEDLQKIISGLVLFSTRYLRANDGGFSPGFDLDKMRSLTGVRTLADQLLMEEGLLSAGKSLQSGFMLSRAIDNFFFLNSTFWNQNLGFYKTSEGDSHGRVWLMDVARAIHNVQTILTLSDLTQSPNIKSLEQMKQLKDLWLSRFLGQDVQKLPPILQVSEFSL